MLQPGGSPVFKDKFGFHVGKELKTNPMLVVRKKFDNFMSTMKFKRLDSDASIRGGINGKTTMILIIYVNYKFQKIMDDEIT